jgi:transcriptional regulator GlxA family with amidase domain
MKITIVAFEGCMTSAVYGQTDAFAIAASSCTGAFLLAEAGILNGRVTTNPAFSALFEQRPQAGERRCDIR